MRDALHQYEQAQFASYEDDFGFGFAKAAQATEQQFNAGEFTYHPSETAQQAWIRLLTTLRVA